MIAAAGGIGGGGILVPIYILVLRFSPKYAVPLSNITIFGGAITNTFLNMKKRHPLADRPLVDWDLILVMEPLTSELQLLYKLKAPFSWYLLVTLVHEGYMYAGHGYKLLGATSPRPWRVYILPPRSAPYLSPHPATTTLLYRLRLSPPGSSSGWLLRGLSTMRPHPFRCFGESELQSRQILLSW